MKTRLFPVVMIPLLVLVFSALAVAGTAHGKPKLVLQITIAHYCLAICIVCSILIR